MIVVHSSALSELLPDSASVTKIIRVPEDVHFPQIAAKVVTLRGLIKQVSWYTRTMPYPCES